MTAMFILFSLVCLCVIPSYPDYAYWYRNAIKTFPYSFDLTSVLLVQLIISNKHYPVYACVILLAASIVDERTLEIPDACSVLLVILAIFFTERVHIYYGVIFLLCGYIAARFEKFGFGDVKLVSSIALHEGWKTLIGLQIACIICILMHITKKGSPTAMIPFAIYLCIGFSLSFLL